MRTLLTKKFCNDWLVPMTSLNLRKQAALTANVDAAIATIGKSAGTIGEWAAIRETFRGVGMQVLSGHAYLVIRFHNMI